MDRAPQLQPRSPRSFLISGCFVRVLLMSNACFSGVPLTPTFDSMVSFPGSLRASDRSASSHSQMRAAWRLLTRLVDVKNLLKEESDFLKQSACLATRF